MRDTGETPIPNRRLRSLLRLFVTTNGLLIVVGLLALTVVSGRVAFAYWTAQATATAPPSLVSGTLDYLLRSGTQTLTETSTDVWSDPSFTFTDAFPGESYAYSFAVVNTGTTAFTWDLTIQTLRNDLGDSLLARVYHSDLGGSVTATNSTVSPRTGTCTGTPTSDQPVRLSTTPVDAGIPDDLVIGPGTDTTDESVAVCVVLTLDSAAPSSVQGFTAPNVRFGVTAVQVQS